MAFIDSVDTMLLGRRTDEMFAGYRPSVTDGEDARFAERLNNMEKFVFFVAASRSSRRAYRPATRTPPRA